MNLCMHCMRDIGEESRCPYCGFEISAKQNPPYLPLRTVIEKRYVVGCVMDYNGEGATYIGYDLAENKTVFIRELLPNTITDRTPYSPSLQVTLGSESSFARMRQEFEVLWSKLSGLGGMSALINVTAVLEDFGTAYAIYDYFSAVSLRDYVLRSRSGYISWEKARQLLMPVLSCLEVLHGNNIIHGGLSPQTLFVTNEGKVKITGFCTAATRTVACKVTPQIFEGYAALEQYSYEQEISPETDVYGLAAVLYRCLIGSDPIPAKERALNDRMMIPGKFAESIPAYVINGIINALQIDKSDRTANIELLRNDLSAAPPAAQAARRQQVTGLPQSFAPGTGNEKKQKPVKKQSNVKTIAITALIVVVIGAVALGALAYIFKDRLSFPSKAEETTAIETTEDYVEVPEFTDRSLIDIQTNAVFNENFTFKIEYSYSGETEDGYIISQSVAPNSLVPKMSEITILVSRGKEKIQVPDVTGMQFDEAQRQLEALGFEVVRANVKTGTHENGEVISMLPGAEEEVDVGSTIHLRVFYDESLTTTKETTTVTTTKEETEPETTEEATESSVESAEIIEESTTAPLYDIEA